MPYVRCPSCRLSAYTAARYSTRELCARCGEPLAAPPHGPAVQRADTGRVSALTKSSSWPVVQHSNASQ
jgi:ribosomal protein S27E